LALLRQQDAQHVQRIEIVRLRLQHVVVVLRGLSEAACAMSLRGLRSQAHVRRRSLPGA
jgi:hypothetical protein